MMKDLTEYEVAKDDSSKFNVIPYLRANTSIELVSASDSNM